MKSRRYSKGTIRKRKSQDDPSKEVNLQFVSMMKGLETERERERGERKRKGQRREEEKEPEGKK